MGMMSKGYTPCTTAHCVKTIAEDLNYDPQVVEKIIDAYMNCIKTALKKELPFAIRGLGKLSHRYVNGGQKIRTKNPEFYKDKVHKQVCFTLSDDCKAELTGWVHDIGIKNNRRGEMTRVRMQPQEIEKIRRRKTLEDQRSLGFRADLLFDEPPQSDQVVEKSLEQPPTVEKIAQRIGINLGD